MLAFAMLAGCVEDVDDTRSTGLLSASDDGFSTIEVFDLGSKYSIDLSVAKGGLMDAGGTVTFSVDQALLDSLNNADGTDYQLLPTSCYSFENATFNVTPGGNRHVVGGTLTYDPAEINKLSGFGNLKYVLPLRVTSTGTPMNEKRTAVMYGFIVKEAIVNFTSEGGSFDETGTMYLSTQVAFENQWDLKASFEAKGEDYVTAYNETNSTFFDALPASYYTLPDVTIAIGKTTGEGTINLQGSSLPAGNYLLPVVMKELTGGPESISMDDETIANFFISKKGALLDRTGWDVFANTQEMTGEYSADNPLNGQAAAMLDDRNDSFWHSQWSGGEVQPPYDLRFDMGQENTISQLGLVPRQNANPSYMNCEIYACESKEDDGVLIGTYFLDGSIKSEQIVPLKTTKTRWFRIYIPSLANGSTVGHIANVNAFGSAN